MAWGQRHCLLRGKGEGACKCAFYFTNNVNSMCICVSVSVFVYVLSIIFGLAVRRIKTNKCCIFENLTYLGVCDKSNIDFDVYAFDLECWYVPSMEPNNHNRNGVR